MHRAWKKGGMAFWTGQAAQCGSGGGRWPARSRAVQNNKY